MQEMRKVVELCEKQGLRDQVKIQIGGAPISQSFCDEIGADALYRGCGGSRTKSTGTGAVRLRRLYNSCLQASITDKDWKLHMYNKELITLIDKAALGDVEAAARIGEGYFKGTFGPVDRVKAKKWTMYAAKEGHEGAIALLEKMK